MWQRAVLARAELVHDANSTVGRRANLGQERVQRQATAPNAPLVAGLPDQDAACGVGRRVARVDPDALEPWYAMQEGQFAPEPRRERDGHRVLACRDRGPARHLLTGRAHDVL